MEYKGFDFRNPDYAAVFKQRLAVLERIREHPERLPALKAYYRTHPAEFINDFGVTFDPRNADIGLPTLIPFVLFPKQREWVDWVIERWRTRTPGICEKSRDMGISWLGMALSCTVCLFTDGVAVGVASRKTEYVDKIGTMKPLLPKGRMFMENLPAEFRGGWTAWRDAPYMRISFPETGSFIGGEGGDDIGRGDRTSFYLVDEAARLERPELVDAALSQTTNCRIDMSSVNGPNNPFARKRREGKIDVFIFDWHDDPRKDDAWYAKQCEELDPVVVAQEIDRDYHASITGVVIPGPWVRAAIDAREKLGLGVTGAEGLALDVADEGNDKNAAARVKGPEVLSTEEWSGKGSDIFATVQRAFEICDEFGYAEFDYDADGLGAGVRGDARVINEARIAERVRTIAAIGYRGSEGVYDPEGFVEGTIGSDGDRGRTNQDFFANRKAQSWWSIRKRFQRTFRWLQALEEAKRTGKPLDRSKTCSPDDIISISSKCPNHQKLVAEFSQPTYAINGVGKIVINKSPPGMKSPNRSDAVVIKYAPKEAPPAEITQDFLTQVLRAGAGGGRRRGTLTRPGSRA
jgi:hypothetical protein